MAIQTQGYKYKRTGQREPPDACRVVEIRFRVCLKADFTRGGCLSSGPLGTE